MGRWTEIIWKGDEGTSTVSQKNISRHHTPLGIHIGPGAGRRRGETLVPEIRIELYAHCTSAGEDQLIR